MLNIGSLFNCTLCFPLVASSLDTKYRKVREDVCEVFIRLLISNSTEFQYIFPVSRKEIVVMGRSGCMRSLFKFDCESFQSLFYLEPIWKLMVDINFLFIVPICQVAAMNGNWRIFSSFLDIGANDQ